MTPLWLALGIVLSQAVGRPPLSPSQSVYTSVRRQDCRAPSPEVRRLYAARQLGVQACPAPRGYRLFVVASDANTWIDLQRDSTTWSSEEAIVYQSPIGLFPSAGVGGRVEWRRTADGRITALIFRVTAQREDNADASTSRLFVARIERDRACVIGRVNTNDEARALADGPQSCTAPDPGRG
jgi:hypothetical protein